MDQPTAMKFELDCYRQGGAVQLVPGARDCTLFQDNEHAVKCLPLSIANTLGWQLLCPDGVTIEWNGGPAGADVTVKFDHPERWAMTADDTSKPRPFAKSHFQTGTVTFETGWLFRTNDEWSMWVMGPPNSYKDGISPLTGVVETYWLDYSFTMNWKMTRPGTVRFEAGEPFCFITPASIPAVVGCQPVERIITDNPELVANVRAGGEERDALMARMRAGDPEAIKHPWGRRYMRGEQPAGSTAARPHAHYNKVRAKPPIKAVPASAVFDQEGRFTPSVRTRIVRCAADAAGLDFLVIDNLLSAETCAELRAVYDANPALFDQGHEDQLWQNRLLGVRGVKAVAPTTAARMADAVKAATRKVAAFYDARAPLYADVLHLAKWGPGDFMAIHADNAFEALTHRAYSGLFYLSDTFDGGGLYLPQQDVLIVPAAGMFVSLPGDATHEHGVVRVERGDRYTMPFFLTFAREKADRTVYPEAAAQPRPLPFSGPANFAAMSAVNFSVVPRSANETEPA